MIARRLLPLLFAAAMPFATAADKYNFDPTHTFPNFEADHMGISTFRGKFTKTSGSVTLDRAARTGSMEAVIDAASIDVGNAALNKHSQNADMFNVEKFPTITYKGTAIKFEGDKPVAVEGELTLLGVTKPVSLTIEKFKCIIHPRFKREVCGADVRGSFKRTDFGMAYGTPMFSPDVTLAIQVEAIKAE